MKPTPTQTKAVKDFFASVTDDDLIEFVQKYEVTKAITEFFDGPLLSLKVAQEELQRRCNSHLAIFFGL